MNGHAAHLACRAPAQAQPRCRDPRLELIHDDALGRLRDYPGSFDVIIGDLNDPVDGGPCYQLYTDDFYKSVVAAKLNPGGIFVTQSGPCGMLSASTVFSSINNTLKHSFGTVVPYSCHVPSFADEWVRPSALLPQWCTLRSRKQFWSEVCGQHHAHERRALALLVVVGTALFPIPARHRDGLSSLRCFLRASNGQSNNGTGVHCGPTRRGTTMHLTLSLIHI